MPNLKCCLRLISRGPTRNRLSLSICCKRVLILSNEVLYLKMACCLKKRMSELGVVFLRSRALDDNNVYILMVLTISNSSLKMRLVMTVKMLHILV